VPQSVLKEKTQAEKILNILYADAIEAGPAVGDEVTIKIISEGIHQDEEKIIFIIQSEKGWTLF